MNMIKLPVLPSASGVYQFISKKGDILYIGKAKNLSKRVKSYFTKKKKSDIKKERLMEKACGIKIIEVESELDALVLEYNLIKKHKPPFNVVLRDDKTFAYLKINLEEDFPRITVARKHVLEDEMKKKKKEKIKYFGPYISSRKIKKTINLLKKIFPFRTCSMQISEKNGKIIIKRPDRKTPCIEYHINTCSAPCIGEARKNDYASVINGAVNFLKGRYQSVIKDMESKMALYAGRKEFEKAAKVRDSLNLIKTLREKQIITDIKGGNRDVLGACMLFKDKILINLFIIRNGNLIGQEIFTYKTREKKEAVEAFIKEYYPKSPNLPEEILLPEVLGNEVVLEKWIEIISGNKIKIFCPKKGNKSKIINLASKNANLQAKKYGYNYLTEKERISIEMEDLKKILKLQSLPKRIEAYDISHLGGEYTVGSMVVFKNGTPFPSHYRRFKIKTLQNNKINDVKSLEEVFSRRISKLSAKENTGIKIRKALEKDKKLILEIFNKENFIKKKFNLKDIFVMEKNNTLIAFGQIIQHKWNGRIIYELNSLWVDKKERGKKLGQKIIYKFIKTGKIKNIYLIAREGLVSYYEKIGFSKIKICPVPMEKKANYCKKTCGKCSISIMKLKNKIFDESFSIVPDLVVIDGGRGQLNAALRTLKRSKLSLKLMRIIALAKKNEEIYMCGKKLPIRLTMDSFALHLLQKIRDEAHRFAATYQKTLRKRKIIFS